MNRKVDGDSVRIRELAKTFGGAAAESQQHLLALKKGLVALMTHCEDVKMDEFKIECTKNSKVVEEMSKFLEETRQYLNSVADELEKI